jgi:hypothetical protein
MGKPIITHPEDEETSGKVPLPPLPKENTIDDAILDDEDK